MWSFTSILFEKEMYNHYTYLPDADIKRSQFLLLNPFGMVGYVPIFKKPTFLVSRRKFFLSVSNI